MKNKYLLLTLVASLAIGTSTFAQHHPPMPPQHRHDQVNAQVVRYYYIPEYNAYFDAVNKVYYYKKKNNKWFTTSNPAKVNKNMAKARREELRNLKANELPYTYNDRDIQTWGRQGGGRR